MTNRLLFCFLIAVTVASCSGKLTPVQKTTSLRASSLSDLPLLMRFSAPQQAFDGRCSYKRRISVAEDVDAYLSAMYPSNDDAITDLDCFYGKEIPDLTRSASSARAAYVRAFLTFAHFDITENYQWKEVYSLPDYIRIVTEGGLIPQPEALYFLARLADHAGERKCALNLFVAAANEGLLTAMEVVQDYAQWKVDEILGSVCNVSEINDLIEARRQTVVGIKPS